MAFNQGCRGLFPNVAMDIRYYRYVLSAMKDRLQADGQGSTFRELASEAVATVSVPRPPLEQQRAIADYLDTETARIDALIAKKRELTTLLLARRVAVTQAGVCGDYTSTGSRRWMTDLPWLPTMPQSWRSAGLTHVARLGSGHTPSREHAEWWEDCYIPWITTGEVSRLRDDRQEYISGTRERISELGLANSAAEIHPAGTVVLSRTASAGFSGIMAHDMATSQDFATWTCGPLLEPRFLLLCLRVMRSDLLNRLAQGSTHKTIYMPDIKSIRVPLPSVAEQVAIVEAVWSRLRTIDSVIDGSQQQVELLREHRQALITAVVTGEVAVPGGAMEA